MKKTNAMRLLDSAKISYITKEYVVDESDFSGEKVAQQISMPAEQVFKTLVTKGDKSGVTVFCIPVNRALSLKKSAAVSHNKKIEMLQVKDIFAVSGYVRGGCSPIGMKKNFATYIDETALLYEEIAVSAGVRGCQIVISPKVLCEFTHGEYRDLLDSV